MNMIFGSRKTTIQHCVSGMTDYQIKIMDLTMTIPKNSSVLYNYEENIKHQFEC